MIPTLVRVTFPLLVEENEYVTVSPATRAVLSALLSRLMPGVGGMSVSVVAGGGGVMPGTPGGTSAVGRALLATCPASMSAWVIAYVAVAVTVWPGRRVPAVPGQV